MKIAIQKKGRLTEPSIKLLNKLFDNKINFKKNDLFCSIHSYPDVISILKLRYDDVLQSVNSGYVDLGIIGYDSILEKHNSNLTFMPLDFAYCKIVLAVKKNSKINKVSDLKGKTIATSFPNLTNQYLNKLSVNSSIINVRGSTEAYAYFGFVDAISDIVETGNSLKKHNLVVLEEIAPNISAGFVYMKNNKKYDFISLINKLKKDYEV